MNTTDDTPAPRRGRRDGTNLSFDARSGEWLWRKVDKRTGKRIVRCTGQRRKDLASRVAARFEDELLAEQAGVRTFKDWRIELEPLIEPFLDSRRRRDGSPILEDTKKQKRSELRRALTELRLRTAADLTHLGDIDAGARALTRQGVPDTTIRRCVQAPLMQFSAWLAGNERYLPHDPLANWDPVPVAPSEEDDRRALMPIEAAKALAALDVLDGRLRRTNPQRTFFNALLVTAPRVVAMTSRDVIHFDPITRRIDFGQGVGDKGRGAGALDPTTAKEIEDLVNGRKDGPLFLSPDGTRWAEGRPVDVWKQALGLALVEDLWPSSEAPDLNVAVLVSRALRPNGRVQVSAGGNPKVVKRETLESRAKLRSRVERLVGRMRDDWVERMKGADVHALRMTHRTWSEVLGGIAPVLIDRQLGHGGARVNRAMEVFKQLAGSRTGRKHYLDLDSALVDPTPSAVAVRCILDEATATLHASGSFLLPKVEAEGAEASAG